MSVQSELRTMAIGRYSVSVTDLCIQAADALDAKDAKIAKLRQQKLDIEDVARSIVRHWCHAYDGDNSHEGTMRYLRSHVGKVEEDRRIHREQIAKLRAELTETKSRLERAEDFIKFKVLGWREWDRREDQSPLAFIEEEARAYLTEKEES